MKTKKQIKEIRKLHIISVILLMLIAVLLMIPHASAQTIAVSSPDDTSERDILVYWSNGTLYGSYNTTSIITLDGNYSYLFTLKPQGNSWIDDPTDWLGNHAYPYVVSNVIPLVLIFGFLGILIGAWKR